MSPPGRFRFGALLVPLAAGLLAAQGAQAQSGYPSKPIRLVVPFPVGAGTDLTARAVAQKLTDAYHWTIVALGFPVFCAGFNPAGPTKSVPGRINHPVGAGGITVHPGDLVVGDADGVVVIEREKASAMLALADKKVADEAARLAAIHQGDTASKWLPAALRAAGVLREGESL